MLNRTSTLILLALLSCALLFGAYINGNLDIEGYLEIDEMADPANPAADHLRIYANDVGGTTKLMFRDSAGTETEVGAGGGSSFAYEKYYYDNLDASDFFHNDNVNTMPTGFKNGGNPPLSALRIQDSSVEQWWTSFYLPGNFNSAGNITLTFYGHCQTGSQSGNTFDLDGVIYVYPPGTASSAGSLPASSGTVSCSGSGTTAADGLTSIACTLTPALVTGAVADSFIRVRWDRDNTDSATGNFHIHSAGLKMPVS